MIPLNSNLSQLKRSGIRVFTDLAKEVPDCVMLAIGEPDFDTPEPIKEAACTAIRQNQTHYAPNQGVAALRRKVAAFETARGNACDESQVLITVGATGSLFTALVGILNPGEEVVIPTPAFPLYETIITIAGGRAVTLDLAESDFRITKEALSQVITDKTKAIILNSPNNPTGAILGEDSLQAVKEAVQGKPIFVICDNVYNQLCYGDCPDLILDPELKDQVLLCQSFSKPYAMTGWRVGYLIGPRAVMERLLLLNAAQITAVPTFLQTACIEALDIDSAPMREIYRKRRDYVCRHLREMGLSFPEPMGAFYVFVDIRRYFMGSEEFCTRMIREAGVAAVPGTCFGAEGFIRLSYCTSDDQLQKGMERMAKFLEKLG